MTTHHLDEDWIWEFIYGAPGGEWVKMTGDTPDVRPPDHVEVVFLNPTRTVRLDCLGHTESLLGTLHRRICDDDTDQAVRSAIWEILARYTGVDSATMRDHVDGYDEAGYDVMPLPNKAWSGVAVAWHNAEKVRALAHAHAARLGVTVVPSARQATTALYRWYDAANRLLYIGITNDVAVRQSSHAKRSSWAEFAARSTVQRFSTRQEAEVAEVKAIKAERPLFNRQHNDTPEARQRLVTYLVQQNRLDLLAPAIQRG